MRTRSIGDVEVGAVGLGCMELSIEGHPDEQQAVATVHAALDAGVRLLDTADAYCLGPDDVGANERLVARALASWGGDRDSVLVATKGGHTRPGGGGWGLDGSPEHLRAACEASLRALGVEAIGLYQHHRPDPQVPYAETLGALAELRDEGLVRLVGISNASVAQVDEAVTALGGTGEAGLASVQNEHSPDFRSSLAELQHCERLGVAFLPWSPFGGRREAGGLAERHDTFAGVAQEVRATVHQVVLAWHLAQADVVVPIPGCSRPATATASAGAVDVELSAEQVARLDGSLTAA